MGVIVKIQLTSKTKLNYNKIVVMFIASIVFDLCHVFK